MLKGIKTDDKNYPIHTIRMKLKLAEKVKTLID